MNKLNLNNYDVWKINEDETRELVGGTRSSWGAGYLARWNYEIMELNSGSPWNSMGSK